MTTVYNTQNHCVNGLCPSSEILTIGKLYLFPSSSKGRETPNLLVLIERANLNHWTQQIMCSVALTWRRKLIQFPKFRVSTRSYLEFRIMDKVQKPSDSECNTNQVTFVQNGWSSRLFEESGFVYKFKTRPFKLYIISYTKLDECCLIPTVPHQSSFSVSYLTLCLFIRVIWLISRIFSESNSHLTSREILHQLRYMNFH
jgi:hypothetical protein